MSNTLLAAIEAEARRTEAYKAGARSLRAGMGAEGAVLSSTGADTPRAVLDALGRSPTLSNHEEQYRQNTGWVSSCTRYISRKVAAQPIRLARILPAKQRAATHNRPRKDYLPESLKAVQPNLELVNNHPALDALDRPNPIMVRAVLLQVTVASMELTGKSYWWVYGDRGPKTIMPLPSSWVEPVHKTRLYEAWNVRPGNASRPTEVPGEEIIYFYYPDPANPLTAFSPLQAAARSVLADSAIAEAQRRSFSNGIWPGYILTLARNQGLNGQQGSRPKLTREQRKQLIAPVLQQYRGVVNYDEPFIIDGWVESITRATNSPRDMDFLKSAGLTKERMTQAFGVNPIVLGQIEGANRASAAAAEDNVINGTINPICDLLGQFLTAWYLPHFTAGDRGRWILYVEPAHAYDPDFELRRQTSLYDRGQLDGNELRTENGLLPRPGGNAAFIQTTYAPRDLDTPHDFSTAAPPAAAPSGGAGSGSNDGNQAGDGIDLPGTIPGKDWRTRALFELLAP